ncbi:MAG: NFACT RNA binding domain-containing protein [Bacteroidota bacterium]|nr:NFACT RNA binding domain-containing protein [Bacteroidota bacterium]
MFTNWLTYRALAEELDTRLHGAEITAVFTQEKHTLSIALAREAEESGLLFSANPSRPFLAPHAPFARARRNTVDLFRGAVGRHIASCRVAAADRLVHIALDDGSALLFVLYGPRCGTVFQNPAGDIAESFKRPRVPEAVVFDNAFPTLGSEEIRRHLEGFLSLPLVEAVRRFRPFIHGTFASELFFRAGIGVQAHDLPLRLEHIEPLASQMAALLEECRLPPFLVYREDSVVTRISLVELTHLGGVKPLEYGSVSEALAAFARMRSASERFLSARSHVLSVLAREEERVARARGRLISPSELEERAEEYEKFGNLLMINLEASREQPWRITLPDLFVDPRLVVSIPLRENETLLGNAQRYYEKARRARASIAFVRERSAYFDRRESALRELRHAVEQSGDLRTLAAVLKSRRDLLVSIGLTVEGTKEKRPFPFRRFTVAGGLEVWAGKSGTSNDELTLHHARPNDLWFHARGVGGSHVVLRTHGTKAPVPKEAIREAAAIAAYYSKHRNARSVPVSYTERKHVRKPRGAPAGTVVIEREHVILVEPRLPEASPEETDAESREC